MPKLVVSDLIGVPFVNGGRSNKGADCWGLVMLVYEVVTGKKIPDYGFDCGAFMAGKISGRIEGQKLTSQWVKVEGPETNAIVLIQNHPMFVNHIGLCLDDNRFIHSMKKTGARIERLDHPLWKNRVRGFYRYAGQ